MLSAENQRLLWEREVFGTDLDRATPVGITSVFGPASQGHSREGSHSSNISTQSTIPRKSLNPEASIPHTPLRSTEYVSSTRGPGWAWEYLALALSASAVTALIILLACIDDMPLSHWRSSFSPTTTISILAAVARATLGFAISSCLGQAKWTWFRKHPDKLLTFERFDDASRGPWGSFWLILRVRA